MKLKSKSITKIKENETNLKSYFFGCFKPAYS